MPSCGPVLSRSDYGFGARLLHRLALGSRAVAETAMDLDRNMFRADPEAVAGGKHVFVSGLARAGTTILMRQLHATGQFRSLTYRDMPFVLAPNLWAKLTGRAQKSGTARERRASSPSATHPESPARTPSPPDRATSWPRPAPAYRNPHPLDSGAKTPPSPVH